jgi:hypothetical protein
MELKDRILALLGNKLSPIVVARTVGCDPSYISQLMGQDDFALEVAKRRCEGVEKDVTRDNKYDELEDALLEKLEDLLPYMLKPEIVLNALTRINSAKRRATVGIAEGDAGKTTIINLILPVQAIARFQLSQESEVIQVGDRPLVNMPAAVLMKSLEDKQGGNRASEKTQISTRKFGSPAQPLTEDSV